jgi:DNA polymerase-3 subunit delta
MLVDINEILSLEQLPPIILLFGQEEFLIEEAYNKIINKFVSKDHNQYSFDEIDASEKDIIPEYVIDMASAVTMLNDKRIIAVKNFNEFYKGRLDKKKHAKSIVAKYFNEPNPDNSLIILATEKSIDGAAKKKGQMEKVISSAKFPYHILIEKHYCAEFPKVWENQLPRFIIDRFSSLNKRIDIDAANLLLSRVNPDIRQIINEIEKIDIYFADKPVINSKDINSIIGSSRNYNIFELQRVIGQKKTDKSLEIMYKMMSDSRQEMLIITMLTRYFMIIWKMYDLRNENFNKFQLAGKVGVSPAFIADYQNALNIYNDKELNSVFIHLADADEELKSSGADAITILQNMIIKITG